MSILPDPDWYSQGACRTAADPDIFVPDRRTTGAEAKAYCGRCPVAAQCLRFAMKTGVDGVWGGTTTPERRRLSEVARV